MYFGLGYDAVYSGKWVPTCSNDIMFPYSTILIYFPPKLWHPLARMHGIITAKITALETLNVINCFCLKMYFTWQRKPRKLSV